jgi:hypothetical protein
VDVDFSLGPGGELPVTHLQGGGGPLPTWLSFVHPNTDHHWLDETRKVSEETQASNRGNYIFFLAESK